MKPAAPLSLPARITVAALVVAAVGVGLQIASGAPYPTVPPAFFLLLIPAVAIVRSRRWWVPLLAVASGLFLTVGLFAAGQAPRLTRPTSVGDTVGLWMQLVAVVTATVAGVLAARARRARMVEARRG